MTSPIKDILEIGLTRPYIVSWSELDKFQRAITSLYEQSTKEDRQSLLIDDVRTILSNTILVDNQIPFCIEQITTLLLHVADGLNTRLPESFIKEIQNSTNNRTRQLYKIIRETYIYHHGR